MKNVALTAKLCAVSLVALSSALFSATPANAQSETQYSSNNLVPLEVVPICSSSETSSAYWKVTNKNDASVKVDWTNTFNNVSGSHQAPAKVEEPASESVMQTSYDGSDRNNTTKFFYDGTYLGTTNARDHRDGGCEVYEPVEPPVQCIDGAIQQNLVVQWIAKNMVSINTVDDRPLCEDVQVYFSSYIMPDNYNGESFEGNVTAYPQPLFDSATATLKKESNGEAYLQITLPDECKNIQVDVYYAPEITVVGPGGHGTQNIVSDIYLKSGVCQEQPGNGGGDEDKPNPTQPRPQPKPTPEPAVSTPVKENESALAKKEGRTLGTTAPLKAPSELPATGASTLNPMLASMAAALMTYAGTYVYQRRQN